MHDDTLVVTEGRDPERNYGVVNPPVYRASTILYPTVEAFESAAASCRGVTTAAAARRPPSRSRTRSRRSMARHGAMVTGSGKTAIVQALLALPQAGDHLLMVDSAYAPTRQLCDRVLARFGVETTYYDPLIGAGIEAPDPAETPGSSFWSRRAR